MMTLAEESSHAHSLAFALGNAAFFHQFRRDWQATQACARAVMTLASEQGFSQWLMLGTIWNGWALTEHGRRQEGIAEIQRGLVEIEATGSNLMRPDGLIILADAYGKIEQPQEGLDTLVHVQTILHSRGGWMQEAELYRLKGELTLQKQFKVQGSKFQVTDPRLLTPDPQGEAEVYFLEAIKIAQKQHAKSLELRATMSLARLWQQQSKGAEAHHMLSEIYGWFTEGFDTKDLQEAKALLEELGEGH